MGDRNWQGGPVLAAKIGPGDRFRRRTVFSLQALKTLSSVSAATANPPYVKQ